MDRRGVRFVECGADDSSENPRRGEPRSHLVVSDASDLFEEWPLEGLEKAVQSFADPEERERWRLFSRELELTRPDAQALVEQPSAVALMRAVMGLDEARSRAALFWTVLALARMRRADAYHDWLEGSGG
jgi:hypothetical protein